jgi:hypothetical protein
MRGPLLDTSHATRKVVAALARAGKRDLFEPEEWDPQPGTVEESQPRCLLTSTQLSSWGSRMALAPLDVICVFNRAKVSFVLAGGYGIEGWRKESRATLDVDLVVATRHLKKAVKAICAAFPNLEAMDTPVVIRLRDQGSQAVLIDLMKQRQPLYREVFKHTKRIGTGGDSYRIPSLEMALAMKYSAMASDYRRVESKYQDAHDFILMVKRNPDFDSNKLATLGELVYPGGSKEVLELARQALAGEPLVF